MIIVPLHKLHCSICHGATSLEKYCLGHKTLCKVRKTMLVQILIPLRQKATAHMKDDKIIPTSKCGFNKFILGTKEEFGG